jgi:TRAP-type uncharacterized transport system substrate-binding protein
VNNLTVNHLHCFVERDVPLSSVDAWIRERYPLRVPVDRVGTVDRLVFQLTLAHLGVGESDVTRWGSRLVPAMSYDEQLELYKAGDVNALWQFMGIPSPSTQAAHGIRPLKALSFPAGLIATLEGRGWTPAELPPGVYGVVDRATPTVAMGTSLGFHADVPDDVVAVIVGVICDHPDRVRRIHPAARPFVPEGAHLHGRGALHPGAARYFRGRGLLPA